MLEKKNSEMIACALEADDMETVVGGADKKQDGGEDKVCPYCKEKIPSTRIASHIRECSYK